VLLFGGLIIVGGLLDRPGVLAGALVTFLIIILSLFLSPILLLFRVRLAWGVIIIRIGN